MRLARCKTCLRPPVEYFNDRSKAVLLLWIFYVFSVLRLLCLCACLFICALWTPAGKGLTSWLSFVVSNCEFVTFPLVSWVRYGTWLYRFLIFVPFTYFVVPVDILAASNCMSSSSFLFCYVQLSPMTSAYSGSGLIKDL